MRELVERVGVITFIAGLAMPIILIEWFGTSKTAGVFVGAVIYAISFYIMASVPIDEW